MAMNMNMKDHMDVSNQENVAPVYFQSLRSSCFTFLIYIYIHRATKTKCRWSILDDVLWS